MEEEYGSFTEILTKNYRYLMSDKRRLVKLGLYSIYLYLVGKRLMLVFKYFFNFFSVWIASRLQTKDTKANLTKNLQHPMTAFKRIKCIGQTLLRMMKFLYSFFIGFQLLYLGYVESVRVKDLLRFIVLNSKRIRIIRGNDQE